MKAGSQDVIVFKHGLTATNWGVPRCVAPSREISSCCCVWHTMSRFAQGEHTMIRQDLQQRLLTQTFQKRLSVAVLDVKAYPPVYCHVVIAHHVCCAKDVLVPATSVCSGHSAVTGLCFVHSFSNTSRLQKLSRCIASCRNIAHTARTRPSYVCMCGR